MALISQHSNLYRTCISILDQQGWKIEITPAPYEEDDHLLDISTINYKMKPWKRAFWIIIAANQKNADRYYYKA